MHFALLLRLRRERREPLSAIETLEDRLRDGAFPSDYSWDKVFKSYMSDRQGLTEDIFEDGNFDPAELPGPADL